MWLIARPDVVERRAGQRQQVDVHPEEVLADDVQPRLGQQVVDVGDPPVGRVLDRQHREVGPPLAHRRDRPLEGDAGQPFQPGKASAQAWCE